MQKQKFMDPKTVLFKAGLSGGVNVVDLGAGSGHFALAAAHIAGDAGNVFVVDILESALEHVSAQARLEGLRNIKTIRADLEQGHIQQIPAGCAKLVIVSNVLHQLKNHSALGKEIYRVLKTGGKVLVIDWSQTPSTFGPKASDRIDEEEVRKIMTAVSLKPDTSFEAGQYHYALTFIK